MTTRFIDRFPLEVQDQLLACCDGRGVPRDHCRLLDLIRAHTPELRHPEYAEWVFDEVALAWWGRRRARMPAPGCPDGAADPEVAPAVRDSPTQPRDGRRG